jgi:hypothetical protein
MTSGLAVLALTKKRSGDYSQNPTEKAKFLRYLKGRDDHDRCADGSSDHIGDSTDLQA